MTTAAISEVSSATDANACVWCGAPLDQTAQHLHRRARCSRCGVTSTFPKPTSAELDEAYGDWYRPDAGRFSGIGDKLLKRTRGRLAKRVDTIAPPGEVLDVGAGDGTLLDALKARGRSALGLEREPFRPDVRAVEITEIEDGQWAAIVFWHSLEHLADAGAAVDRAAALLAPEGVLLIAVPNEGSVQARLFGDRWLALDLPRHLVHIPASALVQRMHANSLKVERVSHWRGGQVLFGWLHGLLKLLPSHPDLYDAIRKPEARSEAMSPSRRLATLAGATMLLPLAGAGAAIEIALHRGGTVYIEARRG